MKNYFFYKKHPILQKNLALFPTLNIFISLQATSIKHLFRPHLVWILLWPHWSWFLCLLRQQVSLSLLLPSLWWWPTQISMIRLLPENPVSDWKWFLYNNWDMSIRDMLYFIHIGKLVVHQKNPFVISSCLPTLLLIFSTSAVQFMLPQWWSILQTLFENLSGCVCTS